MSEIAERVAPAAANGMMIFYTAASVRILHYLMLQFIGRRTQRWKMR